MNPEYSNGGLAVALIQESFGEIKLQHPAVLADQDPEPLHRMRVCFRRLRSTVVQFAPALELPASVNQQAMARIGRRLGLARDLDVLRHRLHDQLLPLIPDAEQQRLKGVFKQLRRERKLAFAELTDTLNSRRYLRLLADLKPWLQQPRFTPLGELALRDWLPEWKASVLCGLLSHPGWFVPALEARGAAEQLHGLRKAIKRARYGLANLEGVEGAGVSVWITTFKGLQQHLGDLNDFDVLERAIANLLDGDPADRLPVFSAALSSLREQSWTAWLDEASQICSHGSRRALYELLLLGRSA